MESGFAMHQFREMKGKVLKKTRITFVYDSLIDQQQDK